MKCPSCDVEMEPDEKRRLICPVPDCGYNEPPPKAMRVIAELAAKEEREARDRRLAEEAS